MSARKHAKAGFGRGGARRVSAPALLLACAAVLLAGLLATWLSPAGSVEGASDPLRISEVMTSNKYALTLPDGSVPDWLEIENTSDAPVALEGYALEKASDPYNFYLFPHGTLGPGERALVYCDGKTPEDGLPYRAPFKLSASGETVTLLNRRGMAADAVTVPKLSADQAYCRDANGEWMVSDRSTPGEANRGVWDGVGGQTAGTPVLEPGALEITEAMSRNISYFPDESGACPDYIEIHNTTGAPVSLAGWALSDSRTRPRKWEFPAITLPADGYLALHCSGESRTGDAEHLHANFKIDGDGEALFLVSPAGAVTDYLDVPALGVDQACSRVGGAWTTDYSPTPGYANDPSGVDATSNAILARNERGVYISEILASTAVSGDWIELYNDSDQAADLSGCWLSDSAAHPRKWQFPDGTVIQPGEYMAVFEDGADGREGGYLHASFHLSKDGGYTVLLSDPQGRVFDHVYLPVQHREISYGRSRTLGGVRYFATPTPLAANEGATYYGLAPMPEASVKGGLYKTGDTVTVELSVPAGFRVYYTLNYTDPTEQSTLYTGPITITETTVLRARTYCEGYMESLTDTQSYLFDVNNGGNTLYVVSMVSDPYNLTSDEAGIMAMGKHALEQYPHGKLGRGANFWMDWEREAHIEVFDPSGAAILSQGCGVKLHGVHCRAQPQKAFQIIARAEYGGNRFHAALFTRRPYTEYQSFLLRTGSQDNERTHMRDEVLTQLMADTSVMFQEYEIALLYIDGQYWGHYNLRERINTTSICQFEGWEGDEDALDLVKKNDIIVQGSDETMQALIAQLKKTDLNSDEAYAMVDAAVDIQNFIEFMAIQIYSGNTDTLNMRRYRNPKADGKWHWALFDLDCGFDMDTNSVNRWLDPEGMGRAKATDNRLFVACMKNDRFRDQFLTHLGKEMASTYSPEHIVSMIQAYYEKVAPIEDDHLARWKLTREEYEKEVKKLIRYTNQRPMRMLQFLKGSKYMKLSQEEMERYFGDVMRQQGVTYDQIGSI